MRVSRSTAYLLTQFQEQKFPANTKRPSPLAMSIFTSTGKKAGTFVNDEAHHQHRQQEVLGHVLSAILFFFSKNVHSDKGVTLIFDISTEFKELMCLAIQKRNLFFVSVAFLFFKPFVFCFLFLFVLFVCSRRRIFALAVALHQKLKRKIRRTDTI